MRRCLTNPPVMEQVFDRAFAAHRDGRLDDAERGYRATLDIDPVHVDALHLLGVLRHQQGQHAEAADLVGRAVQPAPARRRAATEPRQRAEGAGADSTAPSSVFAMR